jgi:hypothetical protein
VPGTFRKTIEFAIPVPGTLGDTPLNKYLSRLDALAQLLHIRLARGRPWLTLPER